jgi:hypothetical protein
MQNKWMRAGLWILMGFAAGTAAGLLGNAISDGPLFGRITWILAISAAIGFGVAEFVRSSRRNSNA